MLLSMKKKNIYAVKKNIQYFQNTLNISYDRIKLEIVYPLRLAYNIK